jgi:hypothetical protein
VEGPDTSGQNPAAAERLGRATEAAIKLKPSVLAVVAAQERLVAKEQLPSRAGITVALACNHPLPDRPSIMQVAAALEARQEAVTIMDSAD